MKRKVVALSVLIALVGMLAGVAWYAQTHPGWQEQLQGWFQQVTTRMGWGAEEEPNELVVSGFIEADEALVRSEVGGRIVHLGADEGDEVEEGQIVVQLDDSLLQAKIKKAEADLALAERIWLRSRQAPGQKHWLTLRQCSIRLKWPVIWPVSPGTMLGRCNRTHRNWN